MLLLQLSPNWVSSVDIYRLDISVCACVNRSKQCYHALLTAKATFGAELKPSKKIRVMMKVQQMYDQNCYYLVGKFGKLKVSFHVQIVGLLSPCVVQIIIFSSCICSRSICSHWIVFKPEDWNHIKHTEKYKKRATNKHDWFITTTRLPCLYLIEHFSPSINK